MFIIGVNLINKLALINPFRAGGVGGPLQFFCSQFNCVKDRTFLLSDFSSSSVTHILSLKLFVHVDKCSFSNPKIGPPPLAPIGWLNISVWIGLRMLTSLNFDLHSTRHIKRLI